MIKKLFFASALLTGLTVAHAQVQVWQDTFDDEDVSDWTLYDEDGDGYEWFAVQSQDEDGNPSGSPVIRSNSYINLLGPVTPDNWIVSPVVDLTNASGAITLTWDVFATDPSWNKDKYSVYVSTGNTVEELTASGEKFTENNLPAAPTQRTVDLSAYAGQQVHIAFRHYDCTDWFSVAIDNVTVTAGALAVSEVAATKVAVYPNPTTEVLNIATAKKVSSVEIYDMLGRKVKDAAVANGQVNVKDLTNGSYILKVNTAEGSTSHKFIKK